MLGVRDSSGTFQLHARRVSNKVKPEIVINSNNEYITVAWL